MRLFNLMQTRWSRFSQAVSSQLSKVLSGYGSSYGNATIFGQMVNVIGGVVQNIILYIEDALTEQNKYTAQRKKSVYGLAALSGYQASYGKAAGVNLRLNFMPNNVFASNVILPNHTALICTQNGLRYNLILPQEAIVLSASKDSSSRYLYAVQGRFETQSFVSEGGEYWTRNFRFTGNLDADYLTVWVNGVRYERAESVYDMAPEQLSYALRTSYIQGMDLIFGNGENGHALEDGDQVVIQYLLHDGEGGNLEVNPDTYFVFKDNLQDMSGEEVDGNAMFNIQFATDDACISGSGSEDIQKVRLMTGLNSRSLALASPDNYRMFINKFSFCGYNRTWSEIGSLVVNSLIIKNYALQLSDGKDYFSLTEDDFRLTDSQKSSIKNAIEASGCQLAGVSYNIFDPELCKYALYIYLTMSTVQQYDRSYVEAQARSLIGEFFSDVASDSYIPKSDIISLIKNNISGVDGVDVYFLSEKNETAMQTGSYVSVTYTYDPSQGIYIKKTERVHLYDGENPGLGLDSHGNILLKEDSQFPVLMGGWDFLNSEGQEVHVNDPLIITFQ